MVDDPRLQAIEWFSKLRSPEATDADRQRHREWLASSVVHREAYQEIEDRWFRLEAHAPWAQVEIRRLERSAHQALERRWRLWLAWAIPLCLVAAVLVLFRLNDFPSMSERFVTAKGEQRRVVLSDGSRLHINSASTLEVKIDRHIREVYLQRGEGLFDVAHDTDRPFVVHVNNSKVVAVGTRFSVYYEDGEVAVTVLEGKVAVLPQDASLPNLRVPGEVIERDRQALIDDKGEIRQLQVVDSATLTSWDSGMLVFEETPLRQVVRQLSRYVEGEIQVAASVPDYSVTGTFRISDRETMLRVLSEAIPVRHVQTSQAISMLQNPSDQELPP